MASTKTKKFQEPDEEEKSISLAVKFRIDQILKPRPYCRWKIIHSSIPNLSHLRYGTIKKLIHKTDWTLSFPEPAFISTVGFCEMDPCHKRTYARRRYLQSLICMDRSYRLLKGRRLYRKNDENKEVCAISVIRMAEAMAQDPDKYFRGRYDWFYTGGNLDSLEDGNDQFVIHATGKDLQNLYVSKVESNVDHIKLTNIFRKRSKILTNGNINPEILEIQCYNGTNVSVRRRNFISLYKFEDSSLKYRFHLYNGSLPFISSTKADNSFNIVTSDMQKTVALWDLSVSAVRPKQLLYSLKERPKDPIFNCVRYIENNMYALIDEKFIYFLDPRQSPDANMRRHSIHSNIDLCETNTIVSPSNFNDLIYAASSHKLQAFDKRYFAPHLKPIIDWTHQMVGYPLMLRTILVDNVERILLASYMNGDVRLCENNKVGLKPYSTKNDLEEFAYTCSTLPLKPPSINDAYRKVRIEGLCLSPTSSIEQRIKYCHSGISWLKSDDNLSILLANSNGDIFSQRIIDDFNEDTRIENNQTIMKQWEDQLLEINARSRNPITVTKIENLEPLKKIFRYEQLNTDAGIDDITEHVPQRVRYAKWQRSLQSLGKYKDALASDLLSVWDFDVEAESLEQKIILPHQQDAPETIIDQWLEQSKVAEVDESILNASGIGLDSFLNESIVPDTSQAVDRNQVQKKDKKAIKRKYVKGF